MANVLNLQTVGDIFLVEVDADPAAAGGTNLPNGDDITIGSMAFLSVGGIGQAYLKTATGAVNWKPLDLSANDWSLAGNLLTGSTPETPNEFFGSTNNFDVIFQRNAIEAMRISQGTQGPGLLQGSGTLADEWHRVSTTATRQTSRHVSVFNVDGKIMSVRDIVRSVRTTSATPVQLFSITTEDDTVVKIKADILVRASVGGTTGNVSSYERIITARNVGGTLSIRQTSAGQTHEDDPALNVTATAASNVLNLNAIGIASRSHDWVMYGRLIVSN